MNTILVSKFYAIKHETGIEKVTESDRILYLLNHIRLR